MSVLPMKQILVVAMRKNRKKILEDLQLWGVLEVKELKLADSGESDEIFQKIDMSQGQQIFVKSVSQADQAVEVLSRYNTEKKGLLASFEGRTPIERKELTEHISQRDTLMQLAYNINNQAKSLSENQSEIPKLEQRLEMLRPWQDFDLPLDFQGTRTTRAFIGTVPEEKTPEMIRELLNDRLAKIFEESGLTLQDIAYDLNVISSSPEQTCICLVCHKQDAATMEEALRQIGYARPPISGSLVPAQEMKATLEKIDTLKQKISKTEEKLRGLTPRIDDLKTVSDYFRLRSEKYGVISDLYQTRHVFLLSGYVPEEDAASVKEYLESNFDCCVQVENPADPSDMPIKLKNNPFSAPVEGVVESYSMPHPGEVDPSFMVSLFYYVFFGLMLSDAGYGIIMVTACAIALKKVKNLEEGMRKTLTMFMYCGVSTAFWGFMFGSFFGDAVTVIATTFFNRPDIKLGPIWFEPINEPMRMLVFSFAVGILHLFCGLGVLAYEDIKAGKIKDAIYDVIFWYFLVGGAILLLLTMPMITNMLSLNSTLPAPVGNVGKVLAIIGAIGIVFTGGRESRSWVKRIMKGLYALYGATNYLSDILSYSRLLALGLATGVISTVFNKMASMVAIGFVGPILFILVFVIGHVINLLINALGAYVHTNRLTFVEFFGKFYEGDGRKFAPFAQNTKYIKVRQDH